MLIHASNNLFVSNARPNRYDRTLACNMRTWAVVALATNCPTDFWLQKVRAPRVKTIAYLQHITTSYDANIDHPNCKYALVVHKWLLVYELLRSNQTKCIVTNQTDNRHIWLAPSTFASLIQHHRSAKDKLEFAVAHTWWKMRHVHAADTWHYHTTCGESGDNREHEWVRSNLAREAGCKHSAKLFSVFWGR